jgi:hypothetical protein
MWRGALFRYVIYWQLAATAGERDRYFGLLFLTVPQGEIFCEVDIAGKCHG